MKRKNLLFPILTTFVCLLGFASCSSKDSADAEEVAEGKALAENIPADGAIAGIINVAEFVESAGGTMDSVSISLPSYIVDLLDIRVSDLRELNEIYANTGVNMEKVGMYINDEMSYVTIIAPVYDVNKLNELLASSNFNKTEKNGYNIYTGGGMDVIAVRNGYIYLINRINYTEQDPTSMFENLVVSASRKSLASTSYGKYILESNAYGFVGDLSKMTEGVRRDLGNLPASAKELLDGYICVKTELTEDACNVSFAMFDRSGQMRSMKSFGNSMSDLDARISADAFKYLPDSESLVMAVALKDVNWNKVFRQVDELMDDKSAETRMVMEIVKGYVNNINGTIAFGIGYEGGISQLQALSNGNVDLNLFPATLLIETKPGTAASMIKDFSTMLDRFGMPFESFQNGFSISIPELNGAIYAQAVDNFLIVSTVPVEKSGENTAAKEAHLSDFIAGVSLYLPMNNQIMRDRDISNNILLALVNDISTNQVLFTMKLTGDTKGAFIQRLITLGYNFMKSVNSYKFSRNYSYYDYEDFDF